VDVKAYAESVGCRHTTTADEVYAAAGLTQSGNQQAHRIDDELAQLCQEVSNDLLS